MGKPLGGWESCVIGDDDSEGKAELAEWCWDVN